VYLAVPARDGHHAAGLRRAAVPASGALLALWALTCALWLRSDLSSRGIDGETVPVSADGTIEDERPLFQQLWRTEHPVRLDLLYIAGDPGRERRGAEPGSVVVMSAEPLEFLWLPFRDDRPTASGEAAAAIGMASVAAGPDVHIVDLWGLAHPVGSRLDLVTSDRPGHQKRLPLVWQVADTSTVAEVRLADGTVAVSRADLDSARAALECGRLRRYLDGVSGPLTPGRFFGNIVDSFANTGLRLSPDPAEAEAELCGGDAD
jgi:arabinofuranosyltransferase